MNVAIVLVSHSRMLAAGLAELLGQLVAGGVAVVPIGGTSDGRLGTDVDAVREAVSRLAADGEVAVFSDLGSALLTSEMVRDELPASAQQRVLLADAPFVEGAVAATMEALVGSDLGKIRGVLSTVLGMHKIP